MNVYVWIFQVPFSIFPCLYSENIHISSGELNEHGQRMLVAQGGEGGSAKTDFLPLQGTRVAIRLDLKLIADIGLVGYCRYSKLSSPAYCFLLDFGLSAFLFLNFNESFRILKHGNSQSLLDMYLSVKFLLRRVTFNVASVRKFVGCRKPAYI